MPEGDGPFPAIIYNHGSEPMPPNFAGQARFYVPRGFILFAPHRRGHGESADAAPYAEEILGTRNGDPDALVDLLETQAEDVSAALLYLRSRDDVQADSISVAGCSLGGVQALLLAERGGVRAALDFSGGAIMWRTNSRLRERMRLAARNAQAPVLFIQAENDFDTTPSIELAAAMNAAGHLAQAHIFPPHGTTPREGHAFCAGGEYPAWGDVALDFLTRTPEP